MDGWIPAFGGHGKGKASGLAGHDLALGYLERDVRP